MSTKESFKDALKKIDFSGQKQIFEKYFLEQDCYLKVDFNQEKLIYPEGKGLVINECQICNFKANENFVVFECVNRLLEKGYKPEHIQLKPKWKVGHETSGECADILIKDHSGKSLLLIACKTPGKEFNDEWKKTLQNGGQLLTYARQAGNTQFVCLYSSDFVDGNIIYKNHIITLKDNEQLLEENQEKKFFSFRDAQSVEDLFKVWKETYSRDFATLGIFEDEIQAYHIGQQKFSVRDLNVISSHDIQGKYHEFATILRQHNVSGRENAFDKLVNLFLCKIVDETRNPDELKFYWKGMAYDSFFELQDRLQLLYQAGMKEFLGEDVTYIDNNAIDEVFRFVKNDPKATGDTIKKYFRELKFFTNHDFAFIDVHNEKLFYQNSVVLLKIVKILQDIRLTTSEQNQFLGDMFEGFLDQGVKQSEGQFFTPMPIVKFILSSLPLGHIISENEQIPKVIDYACGAGHFLNEYALQIIPYVEKKQRFKIDAYHPEITGVEKEYRLAKVAKVSAFMYGQDNIKIRYRDALAESSDIKYGDYTILVSNPPYSVKGFLETLKEHERNRFELTGTIEEKSFSSNNSIEAFFIERAKQLLHPGGVAGIIVPSSMLSKGNQKNSTKKQNVYVACREILLKYFDIVAITEFGRGTFGKTGTNTVTLFLRRKQENPAPADHYHDRVEAWFQHDTTKNEIFEEEYLIKKYCDHLEVDFEDYKTLLSGNPNNSLLEHDTFQEYRKDFENSTGIKKRKKQKTYKQLSKEEQTEEIKKKFLEYLRRIEKDKLYYFVLAALNPQDVIIVKSPSDHNSRKKFLGYEWSSAKGSEGIKYLGRENISSISVQGENNNSELDEENTRILNNLLNLASIQTPLYAPNNNKNPEKINTLIASNFNGAPVIIPESLSEFVSTAKLMDMHDFSRKEFNKTISLTPKKTIQIETKWDWVKLGDVCETPQYGATESAIDGEPEIDYRYIRITDIDDNGQLTSDWKTAPNVEEKYILQDGDFLFARSGATVGKTFLYKKKHGKALYAGYLIRYRTKREQLLPEFLRYITELDYYKQWVKSTQTGTSQPNINAQMYSGFKIPLPPKEIQVRIVKACEEIDAEYEQAIKTIEHNKQEIEAKVVSISQQGYAQQKLSEISSINPPKAEIKNVDDNVEVSFIEMASVGADGDVTCKEDRPLNELRQGSYTYFRENDIILAKITPCMENGKCAIVTGLTNQLGMGSSEFHVIRVDEDKAIPKYVFALIHRDVVRKEAEKNMTGSSGHRRVPASFYENFRIPVPQKDIQQSLVTEIENLETRIKEVRKTIDGIVVKKQTVLKHYL